METHLCADAVRSTQHYMDFRFSEMNVPWFWCAMFVHCWEMLMLSKDCYFPMKTIQRHISFKMFFFFVFCRTQIDARLARLNSKHTLTQTFQNDVKLKQKRKWNRKITLWWTEIIATQNTWSRTKRVVFLFISFLVDAMNKYIL